MSTSEELAGIPTLPLGWRMNTEASFLFLKPYIAAEPVSKGVVSSKASRIRVIKGDPYLRLWHQLRQGGDGLCQFCPTSRIKMVLSARIRYMPAEIGSNLVFTNLVLSDQEILKQVPKELKSYILESKGRTAEQFQQV